MRRVVPWLSTAWMLLAAASAWAVDGVLEINQTKALAGGVTPGDSAGFPVTISQPGSYRLTGNLTVSDPDTDGIAVLADGVSIDLNGFQIAGPIVCTPTGSSVICSPEGTGHGVNGFALGTTVQDGSIRGFARGISLSGARVHRVTAASNAFEGIRVGGVSMVSEATVYYNGGSGIYASGGSVVETSTASSNNDDGIHVDDGSVLGCTASSNGGDGIEASASPVRNSSANNNQQNGIAVFGGIVSDSVAINNNQSGIHAESGSTVQRNTARGNTSFGLNLFASGSSYRENTVTDNDGGTVSGGIDMGSNSCNGTTTCP